MYHAPSVSYPVGRSYILGGLALGLILFGGLSVALWWLLAPSPRWGQVAAALLWWVVGILAAVSWRAQPCGTLTWDGQQWIFEANRAVSRFATDSRPLVGALQSQIDGQFFMALRLRVPGRRPIWLWLHKDASPTRWLALRRAVQEARGL